jgi:uncharacterized Fe-S cluster protein YjdI
MRKTYAGTDVDVSFDPEVCIHAANCVRGLPAVFDTERRPWIVPDAAEADEVVAQVKPDHHHCPRSGHLANWPRAVCIRPVGFLAGEPGRLVGARSDLP